MHTGSVDLSWSGWQWEVSVANLVDRSLTLLPSTRCFMQDLSLHLVQLKATVLKPSFQIGDGGALGGAHHCSIPRGLENDIVPKFLLNDGTWDTIVDVAAVTKIFERLNPTKASGSHGIPAYILKHHAAELANSLTSIFNQSLSSGKVPSAYKLASVCPVFKKSDPYDSSNYRPVSLLPIIY